MLEQLFKRNPRRHPYRNKALVLRGVIALAIFFGCFPGVGLSEENEEGVVNLDQIVVTGTKTPHTLEDVPVETVVITKDDIESINAQNVMDVLGTIPGIQTANHDDVFGTYTWQARMRGLPFDSGYALVLIDGQRVMGCGQSGGMGEYGIGLNQLPLSLVERIEVVKGPGSALYGSDAVAGVINIITKKVPQMPTGSAGATYGRYDVKRDNSDGTEEDASGSRSMSQTYVSYGDRITDRSGYLLYYSYEGADDIQEDPLASDRHTFMGKLDSEVGDHLDLHLKLEAGDYTKTDNRDEDTQALSAGADIMINPDHLVSVKGYAYTWDFVHGYPGNTHGYKVGDIGYTQGEAQYTWNLADWNTLTAGGEMLAQTIDYTIENSDGSVVVVDETVDVASLYIQDDLNVTDSFTIVAGARYDDHSTFGDEVNPKLSLMYRPCENTTFRASAGKSFKSPTIRQLYYSTPYRHGNFYAQSNPDLLPEKGVGYSASLEQWLFGKEMMINAGFFRNDIDDMVVREDTGTEYNGLPLMIYKNVENAWTHGFELMCRTRFTDLVSLSMSYTYTDTENKDVGKKLTYVPEHSAAITPSLDLKDYKLGISATLSYTGKQYTDSDNTDEIKESTVLDAKLYVALSENARFSFEADDVFDSDEGREGRWRTGRAYAAKLDLTF